MKAEVNDTIYIGFGNHKAAGKKPEYEMRPISESRS